MRPRAARGALESARPGDKGPSFLDTNNSTSINVDRPTSLVLRLVAQLSEVTGFSGLTVGSFHVFLSHPAIHGPGVVIYLNFDKSFLLLEIIYVPLKGLQREPRRYSLGVKIRFQHLLLTSLQH